MLQFRLTLTIWVFVIAGAARIACTSPKIPQTWTFSICIAISSLGSYYATIARFAIRISVITGTATIAKFSAVTDFAETRPAFFIANSILGAFYIAIAIWKCFFLIVRKRNGEKCTEKLTLACRIIIKTVLAFIAIFSAMICFTGAISANFIAR